MLDLRPVHAKKKKLSFNVLGGDQKEHSASVTRVKLAGLDEAHSETELSYS